MSPSQDNNYNATIIIFASKKSSAIYIRPLPTAGGFSWRCVVQIVVIAQKSFVYSLCYKNRIFHNVSEKP